MFGAATIVAACATLALWSGAALGQTFLSQGPEPRFGPAGTVQSGDATPNGTEGGAIQAILSDPALGPNTIFAGSTNGGVWVTNNGGANWTALTDNQASLSIASLSLDPTDKTGKTVVAGIGITDNGDYDNFNTPYQGRGGRRTGLLYTTDGGASWRALGGATLRNQSVIDAAARGNTILAATFEEEYGATAIAKTPGGQSYGLYRSVDGGASFSLVPAGSGLPPGPVTSLVADPADPSRFYAAITSATHPKRTSVYISNDTGATWAPVFTAANSNGTIRGPDQPVIRLASGPHGSIAVALTEINPLTALGKLRGVFLSQNSGATWHRLAAVPDVVPGGQAPINLHIAIDPTNANVVYLSGDAYQTCGNSPPTSVCTVEAFRVVFNPSNNGSSAASLTFEGTAAKNFNDANTAHADSRALAFTPAGGLIMTSDGGIYLRNNPQGGGLWQGLNGNLSAIEPYAVAYDANSKRVAVAEQDNGVSLQAVPGAPLFNAINFGDGTNATINDRTFRGLSAVYSSSQFLGGLSRMIINSQGQAVSPFPDPTNPGGVALTCNGGSDCGTVTNANFTSPFALNRIDPSRIAIGGGSDVFVTIDPLTGTNGVSSTSVDLSLADVGATGGPTAIAYGTRDNTNALLVGGFGGVWRSSTAAAGSLAQLTNYGGVTPTGVVYDPRTQRRFFVADSKNLWGVTNGTAAAASVNFTPLTADLPAGFIRPTATEFIANNGVNALLVGGLNIPLSCTTAPDGCVIASTQSPIAVADSDVQGKLTGWRAFGQGLPNTLIEELAYNPAVDVLTAGLIGRGAWVLYDTTSLFAQATILKFGLANNDSTPDASLLDDGTVGARPLIKYGTGTLTIAGNATYTGNTTIDDGTLQLGTGGASGSILGNFTFCGGALDPLCNATANKFLVVDRSDAYTFGGTIAGLGQLVQEGAGTLMLTGNSGGFLGTTLVTGGALVIGPAAAPGAILGGSVTVENGALVAGHGTIGGTLANPSGVVMPGGSIGALKVGGNFVQGGNGTLLTLVTPSTASLLAVGGSASLAGALDLRATPGGGYLPFSKFVILTADGGVTGTFGQVTSGLPILPVSVQYLPNAVDLQLGGFAGGTGNGSAIANALNAAIPTATGDFAAALGIALTLPATQMQQSLLSFGGPIYGNLAQVSLQDRRLFLGAMDERLRLRGSASPFTDLGSLGGGIPGAWGSGATATQLAALGEAINDPIGAAGAETGTVPPRTTNLWARGFGQFGHIGNSGGALGSNYSAGGGAIGADLIRSRDNLFGVAASGGQSSLSVNTLPENGTISFVQLGGYGTHVLGLGFSLDDAGILAHDFYDVSRSIVLPGSPHAATSSHGGNDAALDVGVSRPFLADDWQVTPRAGLSYFHIGQSAFSESGAGGLGLAVSPNALNVMYGRVGVAVARPMTGGDTALLPEIRVAWLHNFLDTADRFNATFIGASATTFGQVGPVVGRDAAELGVGLSFAIDQTAVPGRMSGFVHYDAALASHETVNAFAAGLRLNW